MEYPKPRDLTLEEIQAIINTCEELEHDMKMYEEGYKDGYDAAMKEVYELCEKHLDGGV